MVGARKTQLVQEQVSSPTDALDRFNNVAGGDSNVVPLVCIPEDRSMCSCCIQVPSGVSNVAHKWGDAQEGLAPAGFHCWLSYMRIAYCVTYQSCTYNAPVKSCPTADNVMVDCDLTLVFSIGPDEEGVKNFVYNLGAHRFNDFLAAATEEGIRQLVRSTMHHDIYELRGGNLVRDMLEELNDKFSKFGVKFTQAAITDVQLGKQLETTLQETTQFDSKIKEQKKRHENAVKVIDFRAEQELEELTKKNERVLQDLKAARQRALIQREEAEVDAQNSRQIALTKSREKASVHETRANSEAHVASFQGKKAVEDMLAKANAQAERERVGVEREVTNQIYESEKSAEAAKNLSEALLIEADAEGKAAEPLKIVRDHQLEMAKLEVLESIAENSSMVISGENGDRLINSLVNQSILGDVKLKGR